VSLDQLVDGRAGNEVSRTEAHLRVDRLLPDVRAHKPGTDVMIIKISTPQKNGVFDPKLHKLCKYFIVTLFFEINANICPKMSKISENYDYNIDPLYKKSAAQFSVPNQLDGDDD
jgi:hypothetical protein